MSARPPHVLLTWHGSTPATHIRQLAPFRHLVRRGELSFEEVPAAAVGERALRAADVVVLQRLEHPDAIPLARKARSFGKLVVYDTDDNWISGPPEYHPAWEAYQSALVRSTVERFLRLADVVTVSTPALAETFARYNDAITVLPNTIDLDDVPPSRPGPLGRVSIGYSGTRTHEGDFAPVLPALLRLQRELGSKLRLVFLGFVPEAARGQGLVFEELGFQDDYRAYLATLAGAGIDIAVAPLTANEFNGCKSPIKFLEYGAIVAAGVYSDGPAYAAAVEHEQTGLLVPEEEGAWYEALARLAGDDALRRRIGAAARSEIEAHHTVDRAAAAWREVFQREPRPAPPARRSGGIDRSIGATPRAWAAGPSSHASATQPDGNGKAPQAGASGPDRCAGGPGVSPEASAQRPAPRGPAAVAGGPSAGAAPSDACARNPHTEASLPRTGGSHAAAGAPRPNAGAAPADAGTPRPCTDASLPGTGDSHAAAGAPRPNAGAAPADAGTPRPCTDASLPGTGDSHAAAGAPRPNAVAQPPRKIFYIGAGMLWPHTYIDEMLVRAFSEAGHEVVYCPLQPPRLFGQTSVLWERFEEKHRRRLSEEGFSVDRTLVQIRDESPDLIFAVQGYALPREILAELRGFGAPTAVWMMDEPYDTARSLAVGRYFDHVFLQDAATVEHHRRHGNPQAHYLPHGCDRGLLHRPRETEPCWDLSLVGSAFAHRVELMGHVKGAGRTLLVGSGWEELAARIGADVRPPLGPRRVAEIYRASRVNLMIHRREQELSYGSTGVTARSPNGSVFHAAGCGAFQLVDDSREELAACFTPGEEIVTFSGAEDLREKIAHYLRHEEERGRIAAAARRRAHAEHGYVHRVRRLLELVDAGVQRERVRVPEQTVFVFGELPAAERARLDGAAVRSLRLGDHTAPAPALNAATLETASPWVAFCAPGLGAVAGTLARARAELSRSPDAAGVLLRGQGGAVLGAQFSTRWLWRAGGFAEEYRTIGAALEDRVLSMERQGLRRAEIVAAGEGWTPSAAGADAAAWRRRWGADPERRLDARWLLESSRVFEEWEQQQTAFQLVSRAREMDPEWPEAGKRVGQALFRLGRPREAMEEIEKAWDAGRDDPEAGLLLALGWSAMGRHEAALEVLRACAELEMPWTTRASVQAGIGRCLRRMHRPAEAIEPLERAVVFDPVYTDAYRELAGCLAELGRMADAQEKIDRALGLRPRDPALLAERARLLQLAGREREARESLQQAQALLAAGAAR